MHRYLVSHSLVLLISLLGSNAIETLPYIKYCKSEDYNYISKMLKTYEIQEYLLTEIVNRNYVNYAEACDYGYADLNCDIGAIKISFVHYGFAYNAPCGTSQLGMNQSLCFSDVGSVTDYAKRKCPGGQSYCRVHSVSNSNYEMSLIGGDPCFTFNKVLRIFYTCSY